MKHLGMLMAAVLIWTATTAEAQWATEVIDVSTTTGNPASVLGPPSCANATDFDNVGSTHGFVTVGFGESIIQVPGDDVFVHLNGFQPNQTFGEQFDVLASADGVSFTLIGSADPNDFSFAPLDEVRLGFDLAAGGLASAAAIEVRNRRLFFNTNSEGPDLCGFEAVLDKDGDGVSNQLDVCDGTVIPEGVPKRRLGVNRWALVDGDPAFDTTLPPGGGPGREFDIEDTAGCSCEQIIAALGLGRGHVKFGCSLSAMEAWVELVRP